MTALVPPKPLVKVIESSSQASRNWPQNHIPEEYMVVLADQDSTEQQTNLPENAVQQNIVDEEPYGGEEEVTKQETSKPNFMNQAEDDDDIVGETDWQEEELDLPDDDLPEQNIQAGEQQTVSAPSSTIQESKLLKTVKQSLIPSNHVIFGFFENAFSFWKKQYGIYNFDPLLPEALKVATSSFTIVPSIPYVHSSISPIHSNHKPFVCRSFNTLESLLKKAQKLTAEGKFGESEKAFLEVVCQIPFVKLQKEQEINEVKTLLQICFNYIMAMRCELRKVQEPERAFELSCYMAICNLKPSHRVLALRAAMNSAYKLKNFIYSSQFAKKLIRILEANPNAAKPEVLQSAQKVLRACESQGTNTSQILFDDAWLYDDDATYNIDPSTMKINKNVKDAVKCPYCTAKVDNSLNDTICPLCNLGKLGAQVIGIKLDQ